MNVDHSPRTICGYLRKSVSMTFAFDFVYSDDEP